MRRVLGFDGKLVDIGAAILGGKSIMFKADLEANLCCGLLIIA
jgi:hypothetical protein